MLQQSQRLVVQVLGGRLDAPVDVVLVGRGALARSIEYFSSSTLWASGLSSSGSSPMEMRAVSPASWNARWNARALPQ